MVLVSTVEQKTGYYSWSFVDDRVRIDRVCAAIFEFSAEDAAAGLPISAFIDKMDMKTRERIAAAIYVSISNDAYYDETYPIVLKNGSQRWVRVQGRCMLGPEELPVHSAGTMTDITHLRSSY